MEGFRDCLDFLLHLRVSCEILFFFQTRECFYAASYYQTKSKSKFITAVVYWLVLRRFTLESTVRFPGLTMKFYFHDEASRDIFFRECLKNIPRNL